MEYNEYKILITGGAGFVGSETMKYLAEQGFLAYSYDIIDSRNDIRDMARLEEIINKYQINRILHLAAVARFQEADKNPVLALGTNALGTRNISLIASKYHIPIIYASTGSVYMPILEEPPITEEFKCSGNSVYACTKYQGEIYIKECSAPWIILRYAHLYGREKRMHGLIGGYIDRLKFGMAPQLYGGKQSNDFCYIKDVARANLLALIASADKWRQIYNIGTGEELSAEEAGELVIETYNKAFPAKKFIGKVEKHEGRTVDPSRFVYDVAKAERMLGFKYEYSYEKGLEDMFKGGI